MSTSIAPDPLHAARVAQAARADELRRLATQIEGLRLLDLHRRAGTEVWVGAIAAQCHDELAAHRRQLLFAAQCVRAAARRLEHG